MESHKIYCISIYDETFDSIKKINCIPVGLGKNIKHNQWLRDNTNENISHKNKNYGELTFYYWFWKNMLRNMPDNHWVGFSQYRRHWKKNEKFEGKNKNFNDLVLKDIPKEWEKYETVLGEPINLEKIKFMKLIKHASSILIKEPKFILKKNRNLRFNFEMMHGVEFLDQAISQLDSENRDDFIKYLDCEKSLNPANMFICKSKRKIDLFFNTLFNWLEKCEKIFDNSALEGYSQTRIYAFLSERFLPYWFKKNTKVLQWPLLYFDIRKQLNK